MPVGRRELLKKLLSIPAVAAGVAMISTTPVRADDFGGIYEAPAPSDYLRQDMVLFCSVCGLTLFRVRDWSKPELVFAYNHPTYDACPNSERVWEVDDLIAGHRRIP